jgi:hypothetical protein
MAEWHGPPRPSVIARGARVSLQFLKIVTLGESAHDVFIMRDLRSSARRSLRRLANGETVSVSAFFDSHPGWIPGAAKVSLHDGNGVLNGLNASPDLPAGDQVQIDIVEPSAQAESQRGGERIFWLRVRGTADDLVLGLYPQAALTIGTHLASPPPGAFGTGHWPKSGRHSADGSTRARCTEMPNGVRSARIDLCIGQHQ